MYTWELKKISGRYTGLEEMGAAINHRRGESTMGEKTSRVWRHVEFDVYMRNSSGVFQKLIGYQEKYRGKIWVIDLRVIIK